MSNYIQFELFLIVSIGRYCFFTQSILANLIKIKELYSFNKKILNLAWIEFCCYLVNVYLNVVYFEANHRNGFIYILIHMEVKKNEMFNLKD